jgi:hypothetical protein
VPPPESRADRRAKRRARVVAALGDASANAALDLLELVEYAWHDCYGEVTPSEAIVDDILLVSRGTLGGMIPAAHVAVTDWRDLKVAADALRSEAR